LRFGETGALLRVILRARTSRFSGFPRPELEYP
jgi:hypothetical protein